MHPLTDRALKAIAGLSLILSSFAHAAPPLLSTGEKLTQRQEDFNEVVALTWHRNVMGGDHDVARSLMSRDFIQHDVEEPSGSEEFIWFFTQPGGPPGPDGAPRPAERAKIKAEAEAAKAAGKPYEVPAREIRPLSVQTRLFSITDGNLSLWAYASRGGDPGRFFGSNLAEVKDGKVTQEWYSGPTFDLPADVQAADPEQWYPPPYPQVANIEFVIPVNAVSDQQEAANKALVSEFWDAMFVRKERSVMDMLSPDLVNHIPDQPSGKAFASFAQSNPGKVTAPDIDRPLFVLAEGDLVAIAYPVELLSDPGAWYTLNLVRVKDDQIVEWWYSGYPEGTPVLRYGAAWPIGAGPRAGTTD